MRILIFFINLLIFIPIIYGADVLDDYGYSKIYEYTISQNLDRKITITYCKPLNLEFWDQLNNSLDSCGLFPRIYDAELKANIQYYQINGYANGIGFTIFDKQIPFCDYVIRCNATKILLFANDYYYIYYDGRQYMLTKELRDMFFQIPQNAKTITVNRDDRKFRRNLSPLDIIPQQRLFNFLYNSKKLIHIGLFDQDQ